MPLWSPKPLLAPAGAPEKVPYALRGACLLFCANRMTGRSIDACCNKRTQDKWTSTRSQNERNMFNSQSVEKGKTIRSRACPCSGVWKQVVVGYLPHGSATCGPRPTPIARGAPCTKDRGAISASWWLALTRNSSLNIDNCNNMFPARCILRRLPDPSRQGRKRVEPISCAPRARASRPATAAAASAPGE